MTTAYVYSYCSNEATFGAIIGALKQLEDKVDAISSRLSSSSSQLEPSVASPDNTAPTPWTPCNRAVSAHHIVNSHVSTDNYELSNCPSGADISFSAHRMLSWEPVAALLPESVRIIYEEVGKDYATTLEIERRPIPPGAPLEHGPDALGSLSISNVRNLCDAFFATFNLANPIIDQTFFTHHTFSRAIQTSFGYDVESCVVLAVMALGCWGKRGLVEGGFQSEELQDPLAVPKTRGIKYVPEDIPGLLFFNEGRKRMGFLMNDTSLQACQYHLLTR